MNSPFRLTCLLAIPVSLISFGCHSVNAPGIRTADVKPAVVAVVPKPLPPAIDYKIVKPNEVGRIPVLMYHAIGERAIVPGPRYDRHGLNIPVETFKAQIRKMYDAGWYPVNMRDVLTAHIDVPAGKTPVVLTFDDGRGTQFQYLKDGTIDPDCAVGILEEFHAAHPDWPLRGSFYVMPKSKWNPAPFYNEALAGQKLKYLVEKGFEIANHSTTHHMMARLKPEILRWEMATCVRYVQSLAPSATMDTMALPGGSRPHSLAGIEALLRGADGPTAYENKCILDAWGGPTPSPVSKHFDRREILRIGSEPGNIETWIKRLKPGREFSPYVSDGDPNCVAVPNSAEKEVDPARLDGARLVVWDDRPPKVEKRAGSNKINKTGSKTGLKSGPVLQSPPSRTGASG